MSETTSTILANADALQREGQIETAYLTLRARVQRYQDTLVLLLDSLPKRCDWLDSELEQALRDLAN